MREKREKKICLPAVVLCALLLFFLVGDMRVSAHEGDVGAEFESDRMLIARVIECTAPRASYTARLAIGAVIVNRTGDMRFPDDVRGVVYERGSFECTERADFERVDPSWLSLSAARDALLGFDVSGGALYFERGRISESDGACFFHSGFLFYTERK